ncbi:transcriptional regulator with XRE-family HTH domain [Weissella uvarum]|uniref:helix-turn-helix domain-containing protein n=1 Tax=Weissella uvarum TaxID=1479233 RepID=UPI0019613FE0|nr:helix-turn-helix transcriptional regulator [Weissella uvarum]MBM7616931.1 transcriptional regulator with XRE-family HTH domain [Weissella uvarum]MCM0594618.1 helix-turn-helix transcriptional regulator [Weissella uvarum]
MYKNSHCPKLGEKIKRVRLLRDLTEKELANEINVSVNTLSHYENGTRKPDIEILIDIEVALGVDLHFLLDDEL